MKFEFMTSIERDFDIDCYELWMFLQV